MRVRGERRLSSRQTTKRARSSFPRIRHTKKNANKVKQRNAKQSKVKPKAKQSSKSKANQKQSKSKPNQAQATSCKYTYTSKYSVKHRHTRVRAFYFSSGVEKVRQGNTFYEHTAAGSGSTRCSRRDDADINQRC